MATMKASDVIGPARELLNDETREFFWSEPWLRDKLNLGIRRLRSRRPESKCDDDTGDAVTYTQASAHNSTLCVSDHWKPHLVAFVVWQAFARDRKDIGHRANATAYQAEWERLLATV